MEMQYTIDELPELLRAVTDFFKTANIFPRAETNCAEPRASARIICVPQGNQINATIPSSTCSPVRSTISFCQSICDHIRSALRTPHSIASYNILWMKPARMEIQNRRKELYKKNISLMSLCECNFSFQYKNKKEKKGSQIYWTDFLWMKVDDVFFLRIHCIICCVCLLRYFLPIQLPKCTSNQKEFFYALNKRVTEQLILGINLFYYYWPVLVTTAK